MNPLLAQATVGLVALLAAAACSSGGTTESPDFTFGEEPLLLRVGEPVAQQPSTATGIAFTVEPALPAGLTLNTTTGAIEGTPTALSTTGTYTVSQAREFYGSLLGSGFTAA